MIDNLKKERAELLVKIDINEALIKDLQDRIYVIRKQIKILDRTITNLENLEPPSGVIDNAPPYTSSENAMSKQQPETR